MRTIRRVSGSTALACAIAISACTGPDGEQPEALAETADADALQQAHQAVFGVPLIDLASESHRQVVVDRDPGQYLGHPTTELLEDGTLLTVYPEGHGRGPIVYKRSLDGGQTWTDRLPVPESWATSQEVPTLYGVDTPEGGRRLIVFSGLYPIRKAISDDGGKSWSELEPIGDFGGIVAMASVHQQLTGDLLAFFHDDGRFLKGAGETSTFQVFATRSMDGGLSWTDPWIATEHREADLCEPGLVVAPDGSRLALLLRENSRTQESFIVFSNDDGETWSDPRELPSALTGDRHTARHAPDGRLVVTYRDMAAESPTKGDWVMWVGSWNDLEEGTPGAYRVRLMDNTDAWDAAYPGLELLTDGTFVTTTYGHWSEGEPPYVVSVRLRMEELDARLGQLRAAQTDATESPAAKLRVYADGGVTLDEEEVSLDELSAALLRVAHRGGTAWYFRESGAAEPHPNAMAVIQALIDAELPISTSSQEDFSDVVLPDGTTRPRE